MDKTMNTLESKLTISGKVRGSQAIIFDFGIIGIWAITAKGCYRKATNTKTGWWKIREVDGNPVVACQAMRDYCKPGNR